MPPDPLAVTRQTYDDHAATYAEVNASVTPIQHILAAFMRHIPAGVILDAGCGPGRDAAYFAARGYRVVGADFSASMLRLARQTAPAAAFVQADLRALPAAPASFDGIWACASLLHVPKAQAPAVARTLADLLRPGGVVYLGLKTGAGEGLTPAAPYDDAERFFALYALPEVVALAEGAGLHIIEATEGNGWITVFARRLATA